MLSVNFEAYCATHKDFRRKIEYLDIYVTWKKVKMEYFSIGILFKVVQYYKTKKNEPSLDCLGQNWLFYIAAGGPFNPAVYIAGGGGQAFSDRLQIFTVFSDTSKDELVNWAAWSEKNSQKWNTLMHVKP